MARNYQQGKYTPKNPEKYVGNVNNIVYRSSWECRVFKWLDSNENILSWCSEELAIPYFDPSSMKRRRYFPDFLIKVKTRDGSIKIVMMEVKPEAQSKPPTMTKKKRQSTMLNEVLTWETNKAKWEAAKAFCTERGWEFCVATEKSLGIKV